MKFIFSFLVTLSVHCFAFSMNTAPKDSTTSIKDKAAAVLLIEEGKELFMGGKYREALIKFKLAGNKDQYNSHVYFWQGMTHYRLNNFGYSLQYGEKARELSEKDNIDVHELLAYAFHALNQLDSAKTHYEICLKSMSKQRLKDLRIQDKLNQCDFAIEQLKSGKKPLKINFSESINSGFNDYSAQLTADGKVLYFVSRRENTTGGLNNPDDEQYFEDNYRAVWNSETNDWDSITNNLDRINSAGFDCISYLKGDGLSGLMTLNNTYANAKEKTRGSDICEIELSSKGKWQTPKLIKNKTINTPFFDGAASLTADGNTLVFVSDRRGDKSMTDIYIVQKTGKQWGEAKPISDSINTPYRETTPYITSDGRFLFFSSDGHLGMGGYDIFVSENMGKYWTKPKNLGIQINSVNDDTHFSLYEKLGKILYTTTTIEGLKSHLDIYQIELNAIELPVQLK